MPREIATTPTFRYLRDSVCLTAIVAYFANRLLLKPHLPHHEWFFRGHFNDMLLVPAALPFFLLTYRWLGLRPHDTPPSAREILSHLVLWAFFFEVFGPHWLHHSTADPWDAIAYGVGGLIAWYCWNKSPQAALSESRCNASGN